MKYYCELKSKPQHQNGMRRLNYDADDVCIKKVKTIHPETETGETFDFRCIIN